MQHDLGTFIVGTTWDGEQFQIIEADEPMDLTDAEVTSQFRYLSKTGKVLKDLSVGNGILIIDAENGWFDLRKFDLDFKSGRIYYDIKIKTNENNIRVYVTGFIDLITGVSA